MIYNKATIRLGLIHTQKKINCLDLDYILNKPMYKQHRSCKLLSLNYRFFLIKILWMILNHALVLSPTFSNFNVHIHTSVIFHFLLVLNVLLFSYLTFFSMVLHFTRTFSHENTQPFFSSKHFNSFSNHTIFDQVAHILLWKYEKQFVLDVDLLRGRRFEIFWMIPQSRRLLQKV